MAISSESVTQIASYVGIVKDSASTVVACVGAYVGLRGLHTWRRQIKGQSEHAAARAVLRGIYKWREAIAAARHPFISAAEMEITEGERQHGPAKAQLYKIDKAYNARWARVLEARGELKVDMFDARALWKDDLSKPIEKLERLTGELYRAINRHLRMQDTTQSEDALEIVRRAHTERREVLFSQWNDEDPDPYSDEFDSAVEEIENYLRPKI